jgi:Cyclic nucleotide-binding domain/Major Facilitator Superfamily
MGARAAVLWRVLANRSLRNLGVAFAGFGAAEYGVWTAMLVYAYGRGGATTAGLVAVAQLIPAALIGPPAAALADARGGLRALRIGYFLQAAAMGATAAVLLGGGPAWAGYTLAALASAAVSITRPAQAAALSHLVQTAEELTAGTALSSWIEGTSALVGPALAGVLMSVDGPGLAFAAFAGVVGAGGLLVSVLRPSPRARESVVNRSPELGSAGGNALAGVVALRSEPETRALLGVTGVQYVAIGALDVLTVVLAIGVLRLGSPGAGYLSAAFGAGGILGGLGALGLIGTRALGRPLIGAAVAWTLAFGVLALWLRTVPAFGLLAVAGMARAVLDAAGRALLARITAAHLLARLFGVLEGLSDLGLAAGSLLVPLLVSLGGVRAALAGVAGVIALAALASLPWLRSLDRQGVSPAKLALLSNHGLFAALPGPVLEGLARELEAVRVPDGRCVIREGDVGEHFFLIARGELEVSTAGESLRLLGPGAGFGEIALLHDVRRTASVIATRDCLLYALGRGPFLDALRPAV